MFCGQNFSPALRAQFIYVTLCLNRKVQSQISSYTWRWKAAVSFGHEVIILSKMLEIAIYRKKSFCIFSSSSSYFWGVTVHWSTDGSQRFTLSLGLWESSGFLSLVCFIVLFLLDIITEGMLCVGFTVIVYSFALTNDSRFCVMSVWTYSQKHIFSRASALFVWTLAEYEKGT